MACDMGQGVTTTTSAPQVGQSVILRPLKNAPFQPLQLNPNRIVVAVPAPLVGRCASMPSTLVGRNVLMNGTIAKHHKMRRDRHTREA